MVNNLTSDDTATLMQHDYGLVTSSVECFHISHFLKSI